MESAQHRPQILALAFQPLRDMLVFSGRSTRTEVVAYFVLASLMNMMTITIAGPGAPLLDAAKLAWTMLWGAPWIALFIRRMHDQARSGWWALTFLAVPLPLATSMTLPQGTPSGMVRFFVWTSYPALSPLFLTLFAIALVATTLQLVFFILPGTRGANRFGPDPRREPLA